MIYLTNICHVQNIMYIIYIKYGSSVHGILQARLLEWVTIPSSRDLPDPRIKLTSPTSQVYFLPAEPPGNLSYLRECEPKLLWDITSHLWLKRQTINSIGEDMVNWNPLTLFITGGITKWHMQFGKQFDSSTHS